MKSLRVLLLLLLTAFVLSACGTADDTTTDEDNIVTTVEVVANEDDVEDAEIVNDTDDSDADDNTDTVLGNAAIVGAEVLDDTTPDELCDNQTPAAEPTTREYNSAEEVLVEGVDYRAIFCTSIGAIEIDLFEETAPITVNNLIFLATNDFYNNTVFHRVMADFMAQGGDPTATGMGGPGYRFEDEFTDGIVFDRPYLLAMANAGPGTNGSQFFITTAETPWLNGAHTIYGEVVRGQDVVDSIQLRDPRMSNAPATELETVIIIGEAG